MDGPNFGLSSRAEHVWMDIGCWKHAYFCTAHAGKYQVGQMLTGMRIIHIDLVKNRITVKEGEKEHEVMKPLSDMEVGDIVAGTVMGKDLKNDVFVTCGCEPVG